MTPVRVHMRGFTLVELLVVMAIIAVLASISIPLFARTTFLSSSALQNGSRELYALLRAAKIYAVDHHVDTAVVYGLTAEHGDSLASGAPTIVGNGVFVARALSAKERRALGFTETEARNIFVRVRDSEGQFHQMPDGTCILNLLATTPGPNGEESLVGISNVYVFDLEPEIGLAPIDPKATYPQQQQLVTATETRRTFPAHIFASSGIMVSSRAVPTQGVTLAVAPVPSADPQERAYLNDAGNVAYTQSGDPQYRFIGVEIKPSLGRVKIASDKDIES